MADPDKETLEQLATIEHQRWANWQKYVHSKLVPYTYGNKVMECSDFEHWQKEIDTPYDELTEAQKQSDRDEVMRYWPVVEKVIQRAVLEAKIAETKFIWNLHMEYADKEESVVSLWVNHNAELEQQLKELEEK